MSDIKFEKLPAIKSMLIVVKNAMAGTIVHSADLFYNHCSTNGWLARGVSEEAFKAAFTSCFGEGTATLDKNGQPIPMEVKGSKPKAPADPNAPKLPLSGWALFMKENRPKAVATVTKRGELTKTGKADPKMVMKELGNMWKALGVNDQKSWKDRVVVMKSSSSSSSSDSEDKGKAPATKEPPVPGKVAPPESDSEPESPKEVIEIKDEPMEEQVELSEDAKLGLNYLKEHGKEQYAADIEGLTGEALDAKWQDIWTCEIPDAQQADYIAEAKKELVAKKSVLASVPKRRILKPKA